MDFQDYTTMLFSLGVLSERQYEQLRKGIYRLEESRQSENDAIEDRFWQSEALS